MSNKKSADTLFKNNKFVLIFSFFVALVIWVLVAIYVSPQTTRLIKNVKVQIDDAIPTQFGLQVFGEDEFTVDVEVKGKKYQISNANLSADDITVTALTNSVDSAGVYTLQLKADYGSDNTSYTFSNLKTRTIEVYFDTPKTANFVIEPEIKTGDFPIAGEGYTCGDINLSEASVTITGPSTQVNRVERVVAQIELEKSLTSNKTEETAVIVLDDKNKSDFEYLSMNVEEVVLTIPILRLKNLDTVITFKNAPDSLVLNPLKYSITPNNAPFNIVVDDYDKTTEYVVGSVNFKELSPTSNTFTFDASNTTIANENIQSFTVSVNLDDYTQEYMKINSDTVKINNPDNINYQMSGLNKSVVIVGTEENLKGITEDMVSVEVDLSSLVFEKGETKTVPAVVTVNSTSCWVYGAYTVDITVQ